MAQTGVSLKQIGIDKTNSRIFAITAVAGFLTVFCLVASFSLFHQLTYQNKVISVKKKAVTQLKANLDARDQLVTKYKQFVSFPQNVLGGDPNGSGPNDGSNAKIVLDALPSKYDFPALTASLEKMANDQHVKISSITGTDDEANQSQAADGSGTSPVPFEISVEGDYASLKAMVAALDASIRPMQVQKLDIAGNKLTIDAQTFYQPTKSLQIKSEVVN